MPWPRAASIKAIWFCSSQWAPDTQPAECCCAGPTKIPLPLRRHLALASGVQSAILDFPQVNHEALQNVLIRFALRDFPLQFGQREMDDVVVVDLLAL